jgi:hypothetical protein
MKVTKAVATDRRLPRPLRWAIAIALAVKVVPFPDFGVDEIVYRPRLRAIFAEIRATEASFQSTGLPTK